MGIEDYRHSARYRRRLMLDYRLLFPHLSDPDDHALAALTREHLEGAYESRLRHIEKFYGKDPKAADTQRARLTAGFEHMVAFVDERDAYTRRTGNDPLLPEPKKEEKPYKSIFLNQQRRARLVAIGGGKGGIGKSLVTSNLAIALSTLGKQVVAVDMDLGGADLHLSLGMRNLSRSLNDFLEKKYESLEEVRLKTPYRNLTLIATDSSRLGAANIKYAHKEKILRHLGNLDCDIILVDLGAEVSFNVLDIFLAADHRYIVTSTEPTSVLEAYGLVKLSLYRKIRHFAGELIPPQSELGEVMDEFLYEREEPVNGNPRTMWQLIDYVGKADPELQKKLLKLIWHYHIDLVINMSERNADVGIAQTITRLAQDNLALNVNHSYLVPMDRAVRDCARKLIPVTIDAPTSAAARALVKIAQDASYLDSSREKLARRIDAIARAAKERLHKMGELSALGDPTQPINKIVPVEQAEGKESKLRAFLNKEIRFRR